MTKLGDVRNVLSDYYLWIILTILIGSLVLVLRIKRRLTKRKARMRDLTMTPEGRRLYVDKVFLEALCDSLLECVIRGQITEEEANAKLAVVAKFLKHEELIPLINKKKSEILKRELKANKRRRSMNGKTQPLPIPEPAPDKPKKVKTSEELLASILNS